jgi:hypothetical protein
MFVGVGLNMHMSGHSAVELDGGELDEINNWRIRSGNSYSMC